MSSQGPGGLELDGLAVELGEPPVHLFWMSWRGKHSPSAAPRPGPRSAALRPDAAPPRTGPPQGARVPCRWQATPAQGAARAVPPSAAPRLGESDPTRLNAA